ncbi:MAG TPA: fibronectin type III domain-containing protein [Chthoniobacterales bacterium]|nr:fibronectin type III domain-containing protein [Chthoniobacterales bacterium]
MHTKTSSISGIFNLRTVTAVALCSLGASLGWLSFASTPSTGTLTDTSGPVTYTAGPFVFPNVFGNTIPGECEPDPSFPLVPCDIFKLTVTLPANYPATHPNYRVFVRVEWPTPAADFDLYFWNKSSWPTDSFPQGDPIASSTQTATNFEQIEVPAVGGTNEYVVQVSTTLPAGQSFTGRIFLAPATPGPGPILPPGNASGIAPRFQEYIPTDANGAPSAGMGIIAGEPTLGVNPLVNTDKGGDLFYQALFEILRVRFDDSTSPAKAEWVPKDSPTNISTHVTLDPILLTDHVTGRIWAMQLSGGQSVTDYSDTNGESWLPTISGGIGSGVDHQGMGVGPYPTTGPGSLIQHPLYPNAVYYCSQDVATAFCSRSDDGGLTFGPIVPIYDSAVSRCVGLHGHPKIAPDGTVYVPNKGCGLDIPVVGNGLVNVVVSENGGLTWSIRPVPDSGGGLAQKGDPGVAVDTAGKIYLAYQNLADSLLGNGGNGQPADHLMVATSTDRGNTFSASVDVGALAGVTHAVFPAVVAGDSGRAAVAFFGTTYTGPENYQQMTFPGVWYLYVATTYDGGDTWFVANATPDHPIQGAFGGISNGGDGRNHYDFIDAEIDSQGRIVVSNSIGCAGACVNNGGPNTFQKLAGIVRQSGGRRMFAQFDPTEPAAPAAPLVSGYRTSQFVSVNWPVPDHRGDAITGYNVYRSINGGPETKIQSATTQRQLVELADPNNTYRYRVTAINGHGEGPFSNAFQPTVGQNAPQPQLSCTLPGQVFLDRTSEGGTFPNNDIASFSVAEPSNMPGKVVFVINNAHPELVQNGHSDFYVFFDPPSGGKSYKLSLTDMEVTFYKNGQFVSDCGAPPISQCRDWQHAADLDPASGIQPDGSVRLVIDKAQLGIKTGDVLLGIAIREDTTGNPSGVLATDYAGGRQDYLVVGNDFCTGSPLPVTMVSRKTHGPAGSFDVDLKPPAAGIEPRSGGPTGDYTVVVGFSAPVTVTGNGTVKAEVTSGSGQVGSGGTANGNAVTVEGGLVTIPLTNVVTAQRLTISLFGVNDGVKNGDVTIPLNVLVGDVTANGAVSNSDVAAVKGAVSAPLTESNFRNDITANGAVSNTDVSETKAQVGLSLP